MDLWISYLAFQAMGSLIVTTLSTRKLENMQEGQQAGYGAPLLHDPKEDIVTGTLQKTMDYSSASNYRSF